jgi:hypothetical protein
MVGIRVVRAIQALQTPLEIPSDLGNEIYFFLKGLAPPMMKLEIWSDCKIQIFGVNIGTPQPILTFLFRKLQHLCPRKVVHFSFSHMKARCFLRVVVCLLQLEALTALTAGLIFCTTS